MLLMLPLLLVLLRGIMMALLRMDWVRVAELGEGDVVDEEADDDDHKAKEL